MLDSTGSVRRDSNMKKMIAVLALFAILLSLVSCQQSEKFDIAETTDIVLGNEVDSVVLVTVEGEEITCNNGADFYEIFDKVSLTSGAETKYSCVAETKLGDDSKSHTNMNFYGLANKGWFFELTTQKEGEDAFASFERYSYSEVLPNQVIERYTFQKCVYKEEKAFGGMVIDANGKNTLYGSDTYPFDSVTDTELYEMQGRSDHLTVFIFSLLDKKLFQNCELFEVDNKTYDLNQFVTREYTLYENYIVFKQTAPFLNFMKNISTSGLSGSMVSMYEACLNTDVSITLEAYCNVKTGKIELVKVYGDTLWYALQYFDQKMEVNITCYIQDVSESESERKINKLIEYVKSNSDFED